MRREFQLPSLDEAYLNTTGFRWETFVHGAMRWLLIHDWPIPFGYNASAVRVALSIVPSYPDAQLDMAYFSPPLARLDGKPTGALTLIDVGGEQYQQWSRHRTPDSPWRPGEDDVSSHLVLARDWLEREFSKS
jgi:hypothetical protein